jgi:hypothetical protein
MGRPLPAEGVCSGRGCRAVVRETGGQRGLADALLEFGEAGRPRPAGPCAGHSACLM